MPASRKPRRTDLTQVPDRVIAHAEAAYGLEVLATPPILLDGAHATLIQLRSETCKKAVLETTEGTYFFKEVPWYCNDVGMLGFRMRFEARLRDAGLPVPPVVRTRSGAEWLEIGDERYVLTRFASGRRYEELPSQAEAAGRVLAQMHQVVVDPAGAPAETPFGLADLFVGLATETAAASYATESARLVAVLDRARSAAQKPESADLPRTGVHGDFSPSNLLFADDAVVAVLDFDNADHATPLHDVCEAAVTFGFMRYAGVSSSFSGTRSLVNDAAVAAFARGYGSVRALSDHERALVAPVCAAVLVELLSLGAIRGDLTPSHIAAVDVDAVAHALADHLEQGVRC